MKLKIEKSISLNEIAIEINTFNNLIAKNTAIPKLHFEIKNITECQYFKSELQIAYQQLIKKRIKL